jgi:murein DD-endopeptidase
MRFLMAIGLMVALACPFSGGAFARDLEPSFDLRVPTHPMPRSVDGVDELVYELHLDNLSLRDLEPRRVEVLDATTDRVLAVYEGRTLDQRLDRSGVQSDAETFASIPSGRRGVLFIELSLTARSPRQLRHRITFVDARSPADARVVEGGVTVVAKARARRLSPPLEGGPWLAAYDPKWERGHRRVGYAIGGKLRTPGRFAVDWVKLDASGRKSPEGSDLATSAFSHGEDVLAVADGVIVHADDGADERRMMSDPPAGTRGNSIVLALDGGEFAHYGHLRPGSVMHAPGTRVRAGQKIAEVGFSGSASDPQLHFALTDGPIELASEGLAYVFDRFRSLGRYADITEVGSTPWTPITPAKTLRAAMPSSLSVVTWDP